MISDCWGTVAAAVGRVLRRSSVLLLGAAPTVGGQAVMEGVMIRNQGRLAIAVRKPDGSILLETRPWFSLTNHPWLKKPFVRGFPVLLETLVNGIKSLNWSAQESLDEEDGEELKPWAMALTVGVSIALALGMFVVLPHLMTLGIKALGWGGGTETLSFHAWDGLFKLSVFLGYIGAISMIPDIKRVFQYHGAEHKVIWAYEKSGCDITPGDARGFSRLHPRCGTAFMLFVLCLSIVLHALLIPGMLSLYTPDNAVIKQVYVIVAKFFMMIPVAATAFELIKFSGRRQDAMLCRLLCLPGLMLQGMTAFEPDDEQLEVAIAALKGAVEER